MEIELALRGGGMAPAARGGFRYWRWGHDRSVVYELHCWQATLQKTSRRNPWSQRRQPRDRRGDDQILPGLSYACLSYTSIARLQKPGGHGR